MKAKNNRAAQAKVKMTMVQKISGFSDFLTSGVVPVITIMQAITVIAMPSSNGGKPVKL